MSIQGEIERINGNVQNTISAIGATGIAVPEGANSDNLPSLAQALANEKQDKANAVSITGGGNISPPASAGSAPFTIEMTDEDEDRINLVFGAQSVAASAFTVNTTYEGWGYRAAVALSGVTADYVPIVTFGMADATGGNLAPLAESYTGGVYIYAKEQPTAVVSIASVVCVKEG